MCRDKPVAIMPGCRQNTSMLLPCSLQRQPELCGNLFSAHDKSGLCPYNGNCAKNPEVSVWSEAKSTDHTCRRSHDQHVTVKVL